MKSFNRRSFISAKDKKDLCSMLWDHYLSRKRQDDLEPSWVFTPYALAKKFVDGEELTEEELTILQGVIKSHLQEDGTEVPAKMGFPNEDSRIMHDCWKAGSFSWIFMARSDDVDAFKHKNFIIIRRKIPDEFYDMLDKRLAPQTLFAAYDPLNESKNIGPAIYLEYLLQEIGEEDV